jgi:hypothetical protein
MSDERTVFADRAAFLEGALYAHHRATDSRAGVPITAFKRAAEQAYPLPVPLRAAVWTGVAEPLRIGRFYNGTNGFHWPAP